MNITRRNENMNKIIQEIETAQLKKDIPDFKVGDTVVVQIRVQESNRERLQTFEGLVIAKRNRGLNSSFTVRKISQGEGIERVFQTHSPIIASIKVKRRGDVRKAKLYHLRELSGRAARIKEKITSKQPKTKEALPEEITEVVDTDITEEKEEELPETTTE